MRLALMTCLCLLSLAAVPALAADSPESRPANAPVLSHVHIYCAQLEPMIDFFVKGFDAQVTMRRKFGDNDDGAVLSMGAIPLYVEQTKVAAGKGNIAAYDHIGFYVNDLDSALKKALAAPGVTLDTAVRPAGVDGKGKAVYVRGPEGIRVEIVQPSPGK